MCEKRTRKIMKGSRVLRLREARRLQRLQWPVGRAIAEVAAEATAPAQRYADKVAQCRLMLELAWRTISLVHKNTIIQRKLADLQKETTEYVASVMSHPENQRRYLEHVRVYGGVLTLWVPTYVRPQHQPERTPHTVSYD